MLLESFDTGAGCRTQINERYHASNPVCKPARTTANIVKIYDRGVSKGKFHQE